MSGAQSGAVGPVDPQARLAEIQAAAAHDVPRAMQLAEAALRDGLEHPLVLNLLAHRHELARDYDGALAYLDRALALQPRDVYALNARGLCLAALARHVSALQTYDIALKLQPDFGAAHFNKAVSAATVGDPSLAIIHYERAAALQPRLVEPLTALAGLAARQGDLAKARDYAQRALALRSEDPQAHAVLAQADLAEGDHLAAAERMHALLSTGAVPEVVRERLLELLNRALRALGYAEFPASHFEPQPAPPPEPPPRVEPPRPEPPRAEARPALPPEPPRTPEPRPAPVAAAPPPERAPEPEPVEPPPPTLAELSAGLDMALEAQDLPSAYALAEAALDAGAEDPRLLRLRGLLREQQGRLDAAIADFEAALAAGPPDFPTLNALGLCLARAGRAPEALARLEAAVALAPDFATGHFNRGWTLETLGDLHAAADAYETALACDPQHADALGALAALALRSGAPALAEAHARAALNVDPLQPAAILALSAAELAQGDPASAERRLRGLLSDTSRRVTAAARDSALNQLGDALDVQGRTAEAFAAFSAANDDLRQRHAGAFAQPSAEGATERARRLTDALTAIAPKAWTPVLDFAPGPARGHVFLLGFPRSGSYLVAQLLRAHPDVALLERVDLLADAADAFLGSPEGLARLAGADAGELAAWREHYWAGARRHGVGPDRKLFVDSLPAHTQNLPLIARLFPEARVVISIRDPRDVILSGVRGRAAMDAGLFELLTPEGGAQYYDAVMTLAETSRQQLPLDLWAQRHEDLVDDLETQSRALCDCLGLDWDPAVAEAGRQATGLPFDGPSRWRDYRHELAPALPILEPWIERLGYPAA